MVNSNLSKDSWPEAGISGACSGACDDFEEENKEFDVVFDRTVPESIPGIWRFKEEKARHWIFTEKQE